MLSDEYEDTSLRILRNTCVMILHKKKINPCDNSNMCREPSKDRWHNFSICGNETNSFSPFFLEENHYMLWWFLRTKHVDVDFDDFASQKNRKKSTWWHYTSSSLLVLHCSMLLASLNWKKLPISVDNKQWRFVSSNFSSDRISTILISRGRLNPYSV